MRRFLMVMFVLLLTACSSASEDVSPTATVVVVQPTADSGASEDIDVFPATIDSVQVQVLESFPVQINVVVQGFFSDGCSVLGDISQFREDSTVDVSVMAQRPADAMCTQEVQMFEQIISLDGDFPSGTYTVIVNGVEATFQV